MRCPIALGFLLLPALAGASDPFAVEAIGKNVYAVVRRDAPGYAVESNSGFIVGERDVIVIDAQSNAATTRAVLAALRRITDKPVRYVINTHWHDDHIVGNQVYRDAFPGVDFIGHANMLAYLPAQGKTNRELFHAGIPDMLQQLRGILASGKTSSGQPLSEEQLASLRSDIALGEGYLTVPADFAPVLPTIAVHDRLTLRQDSRTIEVLYPGRGHTSGDIVVHLPEERILFAGDLVIAPIPLIGAEQSHVGDWARSLETLQTLGAVAIVPGHGPVMRDAAYLRQMSRLMVSLANQVSTAVADGKSLDQARAVVDLGEFRKAFAGDSKVLKALFEAYVAGPGIESAYSDERK